MPADQQDEIEPLPGWLKRTSDELKFGPQHLGIWVADINLAINVLRMIEAEEMPVPTVRSSKADGISITWNHVGPVSDKFVTLLIVRGRVGVVRVLNERMIPIAAGLVAKGRPAVMREMARWLMGVGVMASTEDDLYAELSAGRSEEGGERCRDH